MGREGSLAWTLPPLHQQPPKMWGDTGVRALGTVAGSTRTSLDLQWGHEDRDVPSAVPSAVPNTGGSGFQLVPLRHRLPGPRNHVLPVLHLARATLPGQVDLQGTQDISATQRPIHPSVQPLGDNSAAALPPWNPHRLNAVPLCGNSGCARLSSLASSKLNLGCLHFASTTVGTQR